jgi:hypothetical protein
LDQGSSVEAVIYAAARDGKDAAYARKYDEKYAECMKPELSHIGYRCIFHLSYYRR